MTRVSRTREKTVKGSFLALTLFYLLIAFEFFYMASPFALYFYSVYRPGLSFLTDHPHLAWLAGLFLPHIVSQTSSWWLNLVRPVGAFLFLAGFLAFCLGAGQVYYAKLTRRGAALGGLYKYIRHPQYLALAVCGLGMLLLWPRYLVLLIYTTMLFAYFGLARLEEKECQARFGRPYEDYLNRTGMFLPFRLPVRLRLSARSRSKPLQAVLVLVAYLLALGLGLGAARGLHYLSAKSLYALYTEDSAFISVIKIQPPRLAELAQAALASGEVRARLQAGSPDQGSKYLNYVVPSGWSVSEIPMKPVLEDGADHLWVTPTWGGQARIVFTRAVLSPGSSPQGLEIVLRTIRRIPLAEVTVDLAKGMVVTVEDSVAEGNYGNLPLPMF